MPDYPAISFGFLTPESFVDVKNAEHLFSLWHKCAPLSFPDTYIEIGRRGRKRLDFEHLDELIRNWDLNAHFNRAKPPILEANVSIQPGYAVNKNHSVLCASVDTVEGMDTSLADFIAQSAADFKAHFGYVHRVNNSEAKMGFETNSTNRGPENGPFRVIGIYTPQVKRGIPNLFWTTVLGKPCVDAIGREALNSCPVDHISWLSDDTVLLQLTKSVHDSFDHEDEFERIRARAKEHLGLRFFQPFCRQPGGHMVTFD